MYIIVLRLAALQRGWSTTFSAAIHIFLLIFTRRVTLEHALAFVIRVGFLVGLRLGGCVTGVKLIYADRYTN